MLTRACSASVRRSSRWRSQRSTSTTWVCTVAARCPGRVPGRRRCRAIQPVTAFNTGADTSSLARSDTAGSREKRGLALARRSSSREPASSSSTRPRPARTVIQPSKPGEKTSLRYRELASRMFPIAINAMSSKDLEEMIRFRWMVAGGKNLPFAGGEEAYKTLFAYSKGLPRDAIKVCDEVLRELLVTQREQASVQDIERIAQELNLKI